MTEKEIQLLDWVISAQESIYRAIEIGNPTPLPNALRKLASVAASLTAQPGMKLGDIMKPLEYETPEKPKIDTAALDIIREPIADEVPMQVEEEKPIPKKKRVRVDDFDTPLPEKEEGTSRDDKILYYRKSGKTLAWIAEKVGCSPQTVANVVNRHKQKEVARLNSEASYTAPKGGKA